MNTTQQPEALNLEEFRAKVTHAAREPLLARIAELEASESRTITQRDHCEEVIDRMADAVLGKDRHEWTSNYDYMDAAQEVEDRIAELEALLSAIGALADTTAAWVRPVSELLGHISDVLPDNAFDKIDTVKWNAVSALVGATTQAAAARDVARWMGSVDDGGLHNLTPLYAVPAHPAEGVPAQRLSQATIDFLKETLNDCDDSARDAAIGHDIEKMLRTATQPAPQAQATNLLAADHSGMKVDYRGLLYQVQRAIKRSDPGYAEILRQLEGHITELGQRWYEGDTDVVDELLQLYCVERKARAALAAQVKQGEQP